MKQQFEKNTLRLLLVFGIMMLLNLMRKPPTKDWMLVFLFKGYIASILDKLAVTKGKIVYPINLFKWFDISFIFDYLLFPVVCVYYNQATKTSNIFGIIAKSFLFSVPMSLVEYYFETRTSLIKFKKGWNIYLSFISLTLTFIFSRTYIALVRKADNSRIPKNND
ncbi:CBO0543 family protein [Metabacillus schmidteae]|uniref:CBO0543 family protein n=1 Tax=Metabacillus schmidteae TaxID=2730405 RepID=UPI00158E6875|nr:CBO0543 family protein [Metabacillus schmidteae]